MTPAPVPPAAPADESATLAVVRTALLVTYVLGAVGTGVELVLLEHVEDPWQWTPIVLLAASLPALAWHALAWRAARRGAAGGGGGAVGLQAFRAVMLLCLASGVVGAVLHYRGNVEFELEMEPTLRGLPLVWKALRGATPSLAPGTMIQLGLVGLAYAFRHPALGGATRPRV